jgi:hypothetical protein
MFIDYISCLEHLDSVCKDFKKSITYIYFDSGRVDKKRKKYYCSTATYQKYFAPIKQCVELLKVLRPRSVNQSYE